MTRHMCSNCEFGRYDILEDTTAFKMPVKMSRHICEWGIPRIITSTQYHAMFNICPHWHKRRTKSESPCV